MIDKNKHTIHGVVDNLWTLYFVSEGLTAVIRRRYYFSWQSKKFAQFMVSSRGLGHLTMGSVFFIFGSFLGKLKI
jgi:hypothetical protein